MRILFEKEGLIYRPIYNFGFYLITNTLLLDYNFILLGLFKDKMVGYCGNYKKHVPTVFEQNADCIWPKLRKYIMACGGWNIEINKFERDKS